MMRSKTLIAGALTALALTTAGMQTQALAQAKVQFFPSLTGRTGPVAPNATPFANGYWDYMKLVNARGGINGVMTLVEECETAYATDRGVECYERLKGKHGGATVFQLKYSGTAMLALQALIALHTSVGGIGSLALLDQSHHAVDTAAGVDQFHVIPVAIGKGGRIGGNRSGPASQAGKELDLGLGKCLCLHARSSQGKGGQRTCD